MVKRTIEIDDNLDEIVEGHKEEILNNFIDWLNENPDVDDFDVYYQKQGCDFIHESADSCTPVYYSNIDGLYYLYGGEFEESYKNAGMGEGTEYNHRQVAIYCYISDKGFEFQREIQEKFEEWKAEDKKTRCSPKEFIEELKELV